MEATVFPSCIYAFGAILTLTPNLGAWVLWFLVRHSARNLLQNLRVPKWKIHPCVSGTIWLIVNSGIGYASYMIYREVGGYRGISAGM